MHQIGWTWMHPGMVLLLPLLVLVDLRRLLHILILVIPASRKIYNDAQARRRATLENGSMTRPLMSTMEMATKHPS